MRFIDLDKKIAKALYDSKGRFSVISSDEESIYVESYLQNFSLSFNQELGQLLEDASDSINTTNQIIKQSLLTEWKNKHNEELLSPDEKVERNLLLSEEETLGLKKNEYEKLSIQVNKQLCNNLNIKVASLSLFINKDIPPITLAWKINSLSLQTKQLNKLEFNFNQEVRRIYSSLYISEINHLKINGKVGVITLTNRIKKLDIKEIRHITTHSELIKDFPHLIKKANSLKVHMSNKQPLNLNNDNITSLNVVCTNGPQLIKIDCPKLNEFKIEASHLTKLSIDLDLKQKCHFTNKMNKNIPGKIIIYRQDLLKHFKKMKNMDITYIEESKLQGL